MKNVFFVINKEKIYAYVVSIMTIVIIFFMSNVIGTETKNTKEVVSNGIENKIGEAITTNTPNNNVELEKNEIENTNKIDTKTEN